jgi:hypothetical protein
VLSVRLLTLCAPQQIEIGPGGRSGDPNTRAKRSYVGVKEFKSQRSSHQDSHGNGLAVCISASKPHPSGRDQPHLTSPSSTVRSPRSTVDVGAAGQRGQGEATYDGEKNTAGAATRPSPWRRVADCWQRGDALHIPGAQVCQGQAAVGGIINSTGCSEHGGAATGRHTTYGDTTTTK